MRLRFKCSSETAGLSAGMRAASHTCGEARLRGCRRVVDFLPGTDRPASWNDLRRYWGINDAFDFPVKLTRALALRPCEPQKAYTGNAYHLTLTPTRPFVSGIGLIADTGMFDVLA